MRAHTLLAKREEPGVSELRIEVNIQAVRRVLIGVVALLTAASLLDQLSHHLLGWPSLELIDSNLEGSIPTWLSSLALLACSALLAVIAASESRISRRGARPWRVGAALFLFAALDEAAALHERVGRRFSSVVDLGGFFTYSWVIPGTVLLILVTVYYWGFLARLPADVRSRARWGLGLLVGGVLGLELVEGRIDAAYGGGRTLAEALVAVGQEMLEMLGTVLLLEALLVYMANRGIAVHGVVSPLSLRREAGAAELRTPSPAPEPDPGSRTT
jgi:hypothetical protein